MSRTNRLQPAPGKAGIASRLALGHHCPGLPEPGRSGRLSEPMLRLAPGRVRRYKPRIKN